MTLSDIKSEKDYIRSVQRVDPDAAKEQKDFLKLRLNCFLEAHSDLPDMWRKVLLAEIED